jgi:hypothetical protein
MPEDYSLTHLHCCLHHHLGSLKIVWLPHYYYLVEVHDHMTISTTNAEKTAFNAVVVADSSH